MQKRLLMYVVLLVCFVFVTACSSEKKPSKENFKKALAEWSKTDEGFYIGTKELPVKVRMGEGNPNVMRVFGSLVRAGMMTAKDTHPGGTVYYVNGVLQNSTIFDVSEKGKKYWADGKGLKGADIEVIEIINFTEPAPDSNGAKATTVKYKTKLVPGELMKLVDKEAKEEISENEQKLVLTDTGWKVWK